MQDSNRNKEHKIERLTSKKGSTSPATLTALIHAAQTGKEILLVHTGLLCLTQLISKDVEHEFTVTVCVDVTVCLQIQVLLQLGRINQVAVVCEADTVRRVDVEGLGLSIGTATSGRVAEVTNTHRARQVGDLRTIVEDLGSHTVCLQLVDSATRCTGCNTSCILATV